MQIKFTIWVRNELRAATLKFVCEAPDASAAMRQVLERAAREWACDPDAVTIYGIAQGEHDEEDAD